MVLTRKASIAAAFLLALSVADSAMPSKAQEQDDNRLDEAWKDALEELEPVLAPKDQARVNNLAYQAAVTRVCDGYELNQEKFGEAVNQIAKDGADKLDDAALLERQSSVLLNLGTSYGLFLAEGNAKKDDFCANAAELKADTEAPNYWQ